MTETTHETEKQIDQDSLDLGAIFEQVHAEIDKPAKEREQNKPNPEKTDKKDPIDEEEAEEVKKPGKEEEKEPEKKETVDYKAEYEKLQKSVKDTQKSFHENRKQLSAYKKAVEKLKEEGNLLEEEAAMLLDHTKFESEPEDEPIAEKYIKVWEKELQSMRKYSPNSKEIDQYALAFGHFMQTAPAKEIEDVLDELSNYEDDEVEFTKQMLEFGRQYNEDVYEDIREEGSIRNIKKKYSQREKELQESIDKLEKKYNKLKEKYEDYNSEPSNYRLPSGGGNVPLPKNDKIDLAAFYNSLA